MSPKQLDLEVIEQLNELLGDNFPLLISTFNQDTKIKLEVISHLIIESDWFELGKSIHNLKGSCLNIGANRAAHLCVQLEELISENKTDLIPENCTAIGQELNMVMSMLSNTQSPN